MISLRRVEGDSMLPCLKHGQIVLVISSKKLKPSDVVIFRHNDLEKIKRINEIKEDKLYLLGDNSNKSTDSRTYGWISTESVVGKVYFPRTKKTNYS